MEEVTTTTPATRRSHKRLWIQITAGVCLLAIVIGPGVVREESGVC